MKSSGSAVRQYKIVALSCGETGEADSALLPTDTASIPDADLSIWHEYGTPRYDPQLWLW
jgi:hypothetical protein